MRSDLSKRQQDVYDFIVEWQLLHGGVCPTYREIGDGLGIDSSNGVADHIKALVKKGWARKWGRGQARNLEMIREHKSARQRVVDRLEVEVADARGQMACVSKYVARLFDSPIATTGFLALAHPMPPDAVDAFAAELRELERRNPTQLLKITEPEGAPFGRFRGDGLQVGDVLLADDGLVLILRVSRGKVRGVSWAGQHVTLSGDLGINLGPVLGLDYLTFESAPCRGYSGTLHSRKLAAS